MKEKVLELYYLKHLKQVKIAEMLSVTKQYISSIVKSDNRFQEEKENRKNLSKECRKKYMKNYLKTYKKQKVKDDAIEQLRELQKQDAIEMSYNGGISNADFAKWSASVYHVDKRGNLVIDKKLIVPSDVPPIVHRNSKVPTQKFKKKYCFNF